MTVKPAVLRERAGRDIDQALAHYQTEGQTEGGAAVALKFIDALEAAYANLARHPGTGAPRYAHELDLPGLRSWPLRHFPYLIFYVEGETHLDVWRVLHAQRDIPARLSAAE